MKRLLILPLLALSLMAQSGGQAVGIPIQNPSFLNGFTGWQCTYGCSVVQADCNGNPLGVSAVDVGYGGSFSQTLSVTPKDIQQLPQQGYFTDGIYRMEFDVRSCFGSYPGWAYVEVDFGTQELCEGGSWPTRNFQHVIVTCHSNAYIVAGKALPGGTPVQSSNPFVIHITANDGSANGGWPILASNFTFTFSPTP